MKTSGRKKTTLGATSKSVGRLGENALIQRLEALLPPEPRWVRVGRGLDDAAVVAYGSELLLVTCDVQIEGTHFRLDWMQPRALGRRAANVNLSDIAAMGGVPTAAVASLQLPPQLPLTFYDDLMRGLGEALHAHGAALVGGNLARSTTVCIDVTLLGRAPGKRFIRRAGARPGDRVLVTGNPGEAAAGLALLQRHGRRAATRGGHELVRRFLEPTARVREGQILTAGGVHSMIDVSDGLAIDLLRLCDASGVGVEVDVSRLPASVALLRTAKRLHVPYTSWLLGGGEAYELLCTAPARLVPRLRRRLAARGVALSDIGVVLPRAGGRWSLENGKRRKLQARGFDHFGA